MSYAMLAATRPADRWPGGSPEGSAFGPPREGSWPSPEEGVSLQGHCRSFAAKWTANKGYSLSPDSVRVERKSLLESVLNSLSNLVSPEGSTFVGGYDCRFGARDRTGGARVVSVGLLLAETLEFTLYTQWRNPQIVPIRYVVDESDDTAGYAVFKYLKDEPAD